MMKGKTMKNENNDMEQGKYYIDENGRCVIPEGVTEIEKSAFMGCTSLQRVDIPNSVTKIGFDAFSGCTSLKSIDILNSVDEIGMEAFRNHEGQVN